MHRSLVSRPSAVHFKLLYCVHVKTMSTGLQYTAVYHAPRVQTRDALFCTKSTLPYTHCACVVLGAARTKCIFIKYKVRLSSVHGTVKYSTVKLTVKRTMLDGVYTLYFYCFALVIIHGARLQRHVRRHACTETSTVAH